MVRRAASIAIAVVLALVAGCGAKSQPKGALQQVGAPEGQLDLVALPGYVEDRSTHPGLDWVTPFERRSGCRVTSTPATSPDDVTRLMSTGRYDGVSARGDVSTGLVADHLVAPINTDLIPSYTQVFPALKHLPSNTIDGVTYGIPTGRFVSYLIRRPDRIHVPSNEIVSTKLIFDPRLASRYRGGVTAYDNPMYIADAALYLRKHDHSLGIHNVYELDREQLAAAIHLLVEQRPYVGNYWRDSKENVRGYTSGVSLIGPAWQMTIDRILAQHVKVHADQPDEGATGISDSWMIALRARHPNCMYLWMNYMSGANANALLAEHTRQAPANEHACDLTRDPSFCDTYRAADEDLFKEVHFWTTPLRDCGDSRGDVCTTYDDWARAFASVVPG